MVRKINEYQKFNKPTNDSFGKKHAFKPADQVLQPMRKSPVYYSDVAKENIYEANKQAHKIR